MERSVIKYPNETCDNGHATLKKEVKEAKPCIELRLSNYKLFWAPKLWRPWRWPIAIFDFIQHTDQMCRIELNRWEWRRFIFITCASSEFHNCPRCLWQLTLDRFRLFVQSIQINSEIALFYSISEKAFEQKMSHPLTYVTYFESVLWCIK